MNYSKQGYKLFSREEMIESIKNWYDKNHKIVLRDLRHKNNLPSQTQVINEFGSFKNALIECGIPFQNKRLFERKNYSDEELLTILKIFVEKFLENNIFLPTAKNLNESDDVPSSSVYISRFGGLEKSYLLIGYDKDIFNNSSLEKDMIFKYKRACEEYGYVLDSRDITNLSQKGNNYIYAMTTYTNHFGSIHNLQRICGYNETVLGHGMSQEEMIKRLQKLEKVLGRRPIQKDLINYSFVPSISFYIKTFGSFKNALNKAGIDHKKIYKNKNGQLFRSTYELKIANVLDINNIEYDTEIMYNTVIPNFIKRYRFDFKILYNKINYYIEIFGIVMNDEYEAKTKEKIKICQTNKIPLIDIYPNDIFYKTNKQLFEWLEEKIKGCEIYERSINGLQ